MSIPAANKRRAMGAFALLRLSSYCDQVGPLQFIVARVRLTACWAHDGKRKLRRRETHIRCARWFWSVTSLICVVGFQGGGMLRRLSRSILLSAPWRNSLKFKRSPFAIYRLQADGFDGKFDGKIFFRRSVSNFYRQTDFGIA
jgi:hypothetical protein